MNSISYNELISAVEKMKDAGVFRERLENISDLFFKANARMGLKNTIEALPAWVDRKRIYDPEYEAEIRAAINSHEDVLICADGYPISRHVPLDEDQTCCKTLIMMLSPEAGDRIYERGRDIEWIREVAAKVRSRVGWRPRLVNTFSLSFTKEAHSIIMGLPLALRRNHLSHAIMAVE